MSFTMEMSPRGFPKAPFVERVEDFVSDAEPAEAILRKFQELVSKYKFMEMNHLQRKKGLEDKIPEMKKTLGMVNFLITQKEQDDNPIITDFELNDTLYAKVKVNAVDTVYLWLGANVMLEYTLDEAKELLESKLSTAEKSLAITNEDLEFLREQITTVEVNTARVYNWDVKQRRMAKSAAAISESS